MSNTQVIFCLTTQSKYDASAKSSNVIYFCEDTKKIYVGAVEYTKTVESLTSTPDMSTPGESGKLYAYNGNLYMCEVVGTNYVWSRVANVNDTKGTITKLIIGDGLTTSSGSTSVTESDTIKHDIPNGAQAHSSTNLTQTPEFGGTFNVESISTDKFGHVTGVDSHTVKIPQQTAVSVGYENPGDVTSLSAQGEMTVISDVKKGSTDHQIIKVYKTFKLPGDNNTTYTISKGTSDGTIQIVPSTGQPYEVSIAGWGDVAKKSDLNKIFKFCGSVATADDLPSSASEGNVYHVKSDGSEYVYAVVDDNTMPTWENLGTIFDATDYAKSADVIPKVTGHGGEIPKFTAEGALVSSGYELNKSVPSDAKFTDTVYEHPTYDSKASGLYKISVDEYGHVSGAVAVTSEDITKLGIPGEDTDTHYESKNVVGGANATSDTSTALQNGQVYLIHVENGQITSKHKLSGSGATTVTTDTAGNIVIQSTDTNTTYSEATTSAAGLQSANDKEKLDSVATGATKVAFSQTLTSGTKVGTITINGQAIPLYAPTDTDTHHVTHLVVGAASNAIQNSAAANGNVHLVVLDNTTARDGVKIVGSGATEVTSDADGNITIHSTNTDTVYELVAATTSVLGGIKTGYNQSGKNYPVKLDTSNNAYVNVPWTDTNTVYTHPTSGVTAGTYKSVTVDVNGHVTSGSNPTTLAGYGITDAATPSDVSTALTTAKEYSDQLFNSLYNNSDSAVNSIMELVAAMEENSDAIDALDAVAASKADAKIVSTHVADTGLHVTSAKQTNWNAAYTHSTSAHAPSNAQANIIETVKVNGTQVTPSSKAVNIVVPTKLSELENDTGYTTDTVIEYGQATSAVYGLVKVGYTASGKNYPVQLNSSGQMYVNVPWTDTNTDTKVTQYAKSDNAAYPILLAASGQTADATGAAYFDSGVTLNPSTNTIAANISGNSATATKLATARTIALTGSVTGSGTFDGSGNLSIATTCTPANIGALPLSGGTMTGSIYMPSPSTGIHGEAGTHALNHAMILGHSGQDYMNFYEYGGVFNFYKSVNGVNTLLGKITSNGWEGKVNGHNITTSTSAPTSSDGSNGDIWIQYS